MKHLLYAALVAVLALPPRAMAEQAGESPAVVSVGPKGFSIASADGRNVLRLRALLDFDGSIVENGDAGAPADGFQVTRARPIFEGTVGGLYDFKFTPDFGRGRTVIQDAWVTARFAPTARLTVGKFKSPVGLERLQSSNDTRWLQRGFPSSLVPNRDIGLQLAGDLAGGRVSYQAAILNGSNDGGSSDAFSDTDVNDDKEAVLRVFAEPFARVGGSALRGLGFGVAGSRTDQVGTAAQPLLPSFRTPGQATFFHYRAADATTAATIADGQRTRFAPQFHYYAGALGVLGEYTVVSQDVSRVVPGGQREATVDTRAWQLAVSWFLTGEEASFKGFKPKARFAPGEGTWGAFEIKARVQQLDVDGIAFGGGAESFADPAVSASRADSYGIGLNWYLNENLKWLLDLGRTSFEGGAAAGADRDDEDAYQLRLEIAF